MLVELVALVAGAIVPRWRRWRHGGATGRRKLGWAVAIVALMVATVQAYFLTLYLRSVDAAGGELFANYTAGLRWLQVATLVAGTMMLAGLVAMIGHRGIGNGYAVLTVAGFALGAPWSALVAGGAHGAFAVASLGCIVVIAVAMLGWRIGRDKAVAVPLPASGTAPISGGGGIAFVFYQLASFGFVVPMFVLKLSGSFPDRVVFELVACAVMAAGWSVLFARPGAWRATLARAGLAPVSAATWLRAFAASALVLTAIDAIALVAAHEVPKAAGFFEPLVLLFVIATVLDLIDELRARRTVLVPVWPLHAPLFVDVVRDKLASAGIPHYLQATRLRALLWFFGPYVPIMVLVTPDRAPDAERILRELFE
jgi:hypothetical protein